MTRLQGRHGEESHPPDRRESSVMSISALLNGSNGDPERFPRTDAHQTQRAASSSDDLLMRGRIQPSREAVSAYSTPALTRPRAGSSSSQSSERTTSSPRRANRPKYSLEEEAFIWFHRVDLRQEWDTIVHAFNRQFPHSHFRRKSGLECKLYRVLGEHSVPQIREWRKRGDRGVEEAITYHGIIESTSIRYPWMGHYYWAPHQRP